MGPLQYPDMASLLMLIGDVIPFRNKPQRGEVPGIPVEGPMGGRVSGTYGSKWRDPRFVEQEAANRGLRPGALTPASPRTGEIRQFQTDQAPSRSFESRFGPSEKAWIADLMMGRTSNVGQIRNFNQAWERLSPQERAMLSHKLFSEDF